MSEKQASCLERVQGAYESRLEDIRVGLALDVCTCPECHAGILDDEWASCPEDDCTYEGGECGPIHEYGLAFSYVAPGTFTDQNEGYWCYQISWGGPSEEFRFYASGPDQPLYKAEFWFLDWFDGAKVDCLKDETVQALWEWLEPSREHVYTEAMSDA